MKYREKLIQLIDAEDREALIGWIKSQDELDQTAILRELKIVLTELAEKEGHGLGIYGDTFEDFDEKIDKFEDAILDVKFTKAQLNMISEENDALGKSIIQDIEANRAYIIDCIVNNRPNAAEMRQLADQLIDFEKKTNAYKYENWEPIFLI